MQHGNSDKFTNVEEKHIIQINQPGKDKGSQNQQEKFLSKGRDRTVSRGNGINVKFTDDGILRIYVSVKQLPFEELVMVVKKHCPTVDKVIGKDMKILGRFPYQLGFWLAKRYHKITNSISVYDPYSQKFVRVF